MRFLERRPGRAAGEERVTLATEDGRRVAHGLWFAGRPSAGIRPWADLVVSDLSAVGAIAAMLQPGSALMIAYERDETERALRRRVPPAATPIGLAMLRAGCRWFKDWYFPEGGREGGTKLQGTLPLDGDRRAASERALRSELEEFLARADSRGEDDARVREALAVIGAG